MVNGNEPRDYGYTFPMKVKCPQFKVNAKIPFTDGVKTIVIDKCFIQEEGDEGFPIMMNQTID